MILMRCKKNPVLHSPDVLWQEPERQQPLSRRDLVYAGGGAQEVLRGTALGMSFGAERAAGLGSAPGSTAGLCRTRLNTVVRACAAAASSTRVPEVWNKSQRTSLCTKYKHNACCLPAVECSQSQGKVK